MEKKLTNQLLLKYQSIIDEWFVNGFSSAQAYKKFYPKVVKDETARVNFSRIQNFPEIKAYILEKHEEAKKVIDITHEGILQELKNWIEADITETILLSPEQIKKLPIELRRLINKFKHTNNKNYDKDGNLLSDIDTIELQFVSKEKALEMINKHIGFYEKDNRQKAPVINYDSLTVDVLMQIWNARNRD